MRGEASVAADYSGMQFCWLFGTHKMRPANEKSLSSRRAFLAPPVGSL